jgi:hypothetical protein
VMNDVAPLDQGALGRSRKRSRSCFAQARAPALTKSGARVDTAEFDLLRSRGIASAAGLSTCGNNGAMRRQADTHDISGAPAGGAADRAGELPEAQQNARPGHRAERQPGHAEA